MAISDVRPPPLDELVWQSNEAVANVGGSWGVHDNNGPSRSPLPALRPLS